MPVWRKASKRKIQLKPRAAPESRRQRAFLQGRFFQAQHQQQEEGADDGPGTGDDRRGQRDVVDEEADAAHDEHGGGQFAFFHDLVPCGSFSVRQGLRGGGAFLGQKLPLPLSNSPHPEKTFFGSGLMVSVAASQALSSCCSPLCRHAGRKRPAGIFPVSPGDRHGGNCGGRHGKTILRITGRPAAVCSPSLLPCPAGDQSKRFWQEEGSARGGGRPFFKKGPSFPRPSQTTDRRR